MNTSIIPDAKYQELNISFNFQNNEEKLMIDAKLQNGTYQAVKLFDPDLDFEDLQQALNNKHFKMISKTADTLKLKIGLLNLEFKNKEKQSFNELKETILDLTQKLNSQIQKNLIVQKTTLQLRTQIDSMTTKMSDMNRTFEQRITDMERNFSSLIKNKIQTLQTNIKEEKEKVTSLTAQLEEMNKKVQQHEKNQTEIRQDIYRSNKDFAKIQRAYFLPKTPVNQLTKYSKVVVTTEEQDRIKNFFQNKAIKSINFLFRASQNDFLVKRFHQKCDGIPNTLILCETKMRKKIGGFTPLTWEKLDKGQYKIDESEESFVFSLTNNDKFTLKNSKCAIANDKVWGPSFGGTKDFLLTNQSNTNFSVGAVNNFYYNENYKKDDQASLEKFHGHKLQNYESFFLTLEWEVWQVEFA